MIVGGIIIAVTFFWEDNTDRLIENGYIEKLDFGNWWWKLVVIFIVTYFLVRLSKTSCCIKCLELIAYNPITFNTHNLFNWGIIDMTSTNEPYKWFSSA